MAKRPRLGVALGSGSARGWAHVGILRALAAEGITPDLVAACSMGAVIGAVFAAGRIEQPKPGRSKGCATRLGLLAGMVRERLSAVA